MTTEIIDADWREDGQPTKEVQKRIIIDVGNDNLQTNFDKETTIKTKLRYCRSCGNLFPSPHNIPNPKCILCKIRDGSIDEARRDLELYTISELNKK